MKLSPKKLFWLVTTALLLIAATASVVWFHRRALPSRLTDLARVRLKADHDRLVEALVCVAVSMEGIENRADQAHIEDWLLRNEAVLHDFDTWKAIPWQGPGFQPVPELAGRNRFLAELRSLYDDLSDDPSGDLEDLSILLAYDGRRKIRAGDEEGGIERLRDAFAITDLSTQHPTLLQYVAGSTVRIHLVEIILTDLPDHRLAEAIAWLPDQATLREALVDAIYLEGAQGELTLQLLRPYYQGSWLGGNAFDRERTFYLNYLFFTAKMDQMDGPMDKPMDVAFQGDWLDRLTNAFGLEYMQDLEEVYENELFTWAGVRMVILDSLRAQLTVRAEGGAVTRSSIEAVIESLDLRSPFDDQPYRIDDRGRFIHGRDDDYRANFAQEDLLLSDR